MNLLESIHKVNVLSILLWNNVRHKTSNFSNKRYTFLDIKEFTDLNKILKFINEARHRISQSLKSFITAYYKVKKDKVKYFSSEDVFDIQIKESATNKFIEEASQKLCVYKELDNKAFEVAKEVSKISKEDGVELVSRFSSNLLQDTKLALTLLLQEIKDIKSLCSPKLNRIIFKLLSVKKTSKEVYFKKIIQNIIEKMLGKSKFKKLTYNHLYRKTIFLSFYVSYVFRNRIC